MWSFPHQYLCWKAVAVSCFNVWIFSNFQLSSVWATQGTPSLENTGSLSSPLDTPRTIFFPFHLPSLCPYFFPFFIFLIALTDLLALITGWIPVFFKLEEAELHLIFHFSPKYLVWMTQQFFFPVGNISATQLLAFVPGRASWWLADIEQSVSSTQIFFLRLSHVVNSQLVVEVLLISLLHESLCFAPLNWRTLKLKRNIFNPCVSGYALRNTFNKEISGVSNELILSKA